MCVGPEQTLYRFHVAVVHPVHGGAGLFEVQFYAPLSSRHVSELAQLVQVYAFQEPFERFYERIIRHLTPYATVRMDRNVEANGMEETNEMLAEMNDRGEFYFIVPVGEESWEHISMAEDPLAERVMQHLYA